MSQSKNRKNKEENADEFSANVKGIIAIMITLLVVVVVVMIFAKSLFVGGGKNDTPAKTGAINQNISYAENPVTTASKKAETTQDDFFNDDEEEDEDSTADSKDTDEKGNKAVNIKCISAVYLHPTPSSNAANLATIPVGATVKFYRNENGWYYVEYEGQKGYAYSTFFETPKT